MRGVQSALAANARRNAAGGAGRFWRWRGTRAAAWALRGRHVERGATTAGTGAGTGHTLPLGRRARRAGRLDLIDLDARALRRSRVRAGRIAQDVTHGAADAVIANAVAGGPPVW